MRPNNRRFSEIMLGLLLLGIGVSALFTEGNLFMMLLVIGGIFMLVRQFENGKSASREKPRPRRRTRSDARPGRDDRNHHNRIYYHALEAVEAAGHDPEAIQVLTTDIGVMAFKEDQHPVVYRTREVLDDVDYIQPYVQLRLPAPAVGLIRFEIIDSDGQKLFVHEERHQFERGRNLITPAARLPIHDAHNMHGDWALRVSADGMLLAVHEFQWQESTLKAVRRHLSEDGEISNELRAVIEENRLQRLSLDDLLAEQDDDLENYEDEEQARQRG